MNSFSFFTSSSNAKSLPFTSSIIFFLKDSSVRIFLLSASGDVSSIKLSPEEIFLSVDERGVISDSNSSSYSPKYSPAASEPSTRFRSSFSLNSRFASFEQKTIFGFSSNSLDIINAVSEPLIPVKKRSFPFFSVMVLNSGDRYILSFISFNTIGCSG